MAVTKTKKKPPLTEAPGDAGNLRTYEFHGILFHKLEAGEHKGSCPFCHGKAFHVNAEEGFFHCKTCTKQGNKYTFLQLYYDHWFDKTTSKQLAVLAKDRGVPAEAFEMAELAYDKDNSRWLIPHRNTKGSMVNLGVWNPKNFIEGKRPIFGTAGCKAHLYNLDSIGDSKTIYLCEGQWDAIALQWLLYQNKIKDAAVLAVPGATTFKEEWSEHFTGRTVIMLYDNDETGVKGMERASDIIRKFAKARGLSQIQWPDSFPEKFDIRDLISQNASKPKKCFGIFRKLINEVALHTSKAAGVTCKSFDELVEQFSKHVYMTDEMRDALTVICAVTLSNKIFDNPFCPLWFFIVGPSGCGKTLLLQSTSDLDIVSFQTVMTPKTLVSGYKTSDGHDPSLLPTIIGKTLVIEDFTGVLTMPKQEQEEIHGVLRSCYNGRYEKSYGHVGLRVYPSPDSGHDTCHFTALAGVTSDIHADRRANHGERWLKFRMKPQDEDQVLQVEAAMNNTIRQVAPELELRKYVTAFIEHCLATKRELPTVDDWVKERINGLGQIVSMIQAVCLREKGELVIRPEAGIASRISQQLIKTGQAVAYALGKKKIDEEVYRIIQKAGFDTCYGWHSIILTAVAQSDPQEGIERRTISKLEKISSVTVHRCLEDMLELGCVEFDIEEEREGKGRPEQKWKLTSFMRSLFDRAKIPMQSSSSRKEPSVKKKPTKKSKKVVKKPKKKVRMAK